MMTATTIMGTTPPPQEHPRRSRTVLLVLAALLAVGLVAGGWYWVTNPRALFGYGDLQSGPIARGRVFSDVMLFPESTRPGARETLTVTSLTPRIAQNTAGAGIVFWVCRSISATPVLQMVAVSQSPASSCSQWHRLSGSERLTIGDPRTRVIAQITTRSAGRVEIAGYDVSYRQGLRRGRQHVGLDSIFTAS